MKKYVKYLIVLASALVSLSCGEREADPFLFLSFPSVSAEAEGKTIDLTVSSNQSWTASADVPWLTVSPASGTGSVDVKVTVAGNNDEARK
ncbi:MAG: BACON domain-containing protein, partial [Bacteroidales bacterium]|nr:BACON domain-containing protein [Bacteroidales bacterium]